MQVSRGLFTEFLKASCKPNYVLKYSQKTFYDDLGPL